MILELLYKQKYSNNLFEHLCIFIPPTFLYSLLMSICVRASSYLFLSLVHFSVPGRGTLIPRPGTLVPRLGTQVPRRGTTFPLYRINSFP